MRMFIAGLLVLIAPPAFAEEHVDGEPLKLPLTFDALDWDCSSRCVAADTKGALLCLDGTEALSSYNCSAAWVEPTLADPSKIGWKELLRGGEMQVKKLSANLAAINKRTKGAHNIDAIFETSEPFTATTPHGVVLSDNGSASMKVTPEALRISHRGFVGHLDWQPVAALEGGEEVRVFVYQLGTRYLATLVIKDPGFVVQRTTWAFFTPDVATVPPTSKAAICPELAHCPADYAATKPLFEGFCAGTLSDADFTRLAVEAGQKKVTVETLVALFNLHGAFYGYTFKQELWLNAFYYGRGDWLPPACVPLMKRWTKAGEVPAAQTKARDRVKTIWQQVK